MKKPLILLSIAMGILLCSCSDDIETVGNDLLTPEPVATTLQENNRVNINAIVALNQDSVPDSRSSDNIRQRIECIKGQANDTCLYVYKNEKGGWTMYSTDTRVPPILAQSDSGSFENLMRIDAARLWIQSMAEDLAIIKRLPDTKLKFSQKEIEDNKNFWKSISEPDEFVKQKISIGDIDSTRLIPRGHYELYRTITYTQVYDSIAPMISTRWHQGSPYNRGCPDKTIIEDLELKAPAGCVPIAGAQVLLYLHRHLGVPEKAPSLCPCVGNIDSYTSDQSNYTSDVWDMMLIDDYYAAPLIANLGKLTNIKYGNTRSSTTLPPLKDAFGQYNIECSYIDGYNVETLKSSLLNNLPVIIGANSSGPETGGHAFIVDRYKRVRTVYESLYIWKYDDVKEGQILPYVKDKVEYSYSSPVISMIGMNWGWGRKAFFENEWYTLTGDWIATYDKNYNWNIYRDMLYGFKVKQ